MQQWILASSLLLSLTLPLSSPPPIVSIDESPLPSDSPPILTVLPPPLQINASESNFYFYEEDLDDAKGLKVKAQFGYRVPKSSSLAPGYELSLTLTSHTEEPQLKSMGNQALIQIHSPRNGLLRFRVLLSKDEQKKENSITESPVLSATTYKVTYRTTEKSAPFFHRLVHELEGGRSAILLLSYQNLAKKLHLNLKFNLRLMKEMERFPASLSTDSPPDHPIRIPTPSP